MVEQFNFNNSTPSKSFEQKIRESHEKIKKYSQMDHFENIKQIKLNEIDESNLSSLNIVFDRDDNGKNKDKFSLTDKFKITNQIDFNNENCNDVLSSIRVDNLFCSNENFLGNMTISNSPLKYKSKQNESIALSLNNESKNLKNICKKSNNKLNSSSVEFKKYETFKNSSLDQSKIKNLTNFSYVNNDEKSEHNTFKESKSFHRRYISENNNDHKTLCNFENKNLVLEDENFIRYNENSEELKKMNFSQEDRRTESETKTEEALLKNSECFKENNISDTLKVNVSTEIRNYEKFNKSLIEKINFAKLENMSLKNKLHEQLKLRKSELIHKE